MRIVIILLIGYLIGNFSTSYFVGKANNVDVRTKGSGNLGATNTLRVLGLKAGLITFVGDLLKGALAALVGKMIMDGALVGGMIGGLGVVLGHNWPVFLRFKGGKGVAATGGVAFALTPLIGLIVMCVGFGTVAISKYVSIGSVVALITYVSLFFIFGLGTTPIIIACIIGCVGIIRHKDNIKRLIDGNENKIGNKSVS
jgi:glycerol-3-phosphate acyltransferase PlsY